MTTSRLNGLRGRKWAPLRLLSGMAVLVLCVAPLAATANTLYVALTDQSFNGVALFTETLGLIEQQEVPGPVTAIAQGAPGTYYLAYGNTVSHRSDANAVLRDVSGSATTQLPSLAFDGDELYVGVIDQSFEGLARFTPGLGLLGQVGVSQAPTALASGPGDTLFLGSGNSLLQIQEDGSIVRSISGSTTTVINDLSFLDGVLYVALDDQSFHGVAMFTGALGLIDQIEVAGPADAIAAGLGGTFYLGSERSIYHYTGAGAILGSISGSATTQIVDLAFVPEPGTVLLFGAGLLGLALTGRRRV